MHIGTDKIVELGELNSADKILTHSSDGYGSFLLIIIANQFLFTQHSDCEKKRRNFLLYSRKISAKRKE